jgi:hypothetical protein
MAILEEESAAGRLIREPVPKLDSSGSGWPTTKKFPEVFISTKRLEMPQYDMNILEKCITPPVFKFSSTTIYFMKTAFSYIRFSSPEQAKGDSFRRQSEKAEAWAKANGYTIAKSWADLGVSGYRGRNARTGNFGEFLRAAKNGELPKDSVLLVENLDRVSRQTPSGSFEHC